MPAQALPTPSGDVLARARSGDERAFLALYRAAQPGLLRYLSVLVGPHAALVAEHTWAEVAGDLRSFEGDLEEFRVWVTSVARRRAGEHEPDGDPHVALDPSLHAPRTAAALRAIADLPRQESEAVLLQAALGIDESDAARILGVSPSAVRRRLNRALAVLGSRLTSRPSLVRGSAQPEQLRAETLARLRHDLTPPHGVRVS